MIYVFELFKMQNFRNKNLSFWKRAFFVSIDHF